MLRLDEPVRERGPGGRPARIIATDGKGDYPVVALIDNGTVEFARSFTRDGHVFMNSVSPSDLVNILKPTTVWVVQARKDTENRVMLRETERETRETEDAYRGSEWTVYVHEITLPVIDDA